MYLRGSNWNMRQRRKPTNWFLVIFLALLIAVVVYLDRFVVPTVQPPFMPTPTATRNPESYATEANGLFTQGKLSQAIDVYNEAISINPSDPSLYIALAQVQAFAGKYDDALTSARNALLLNPNNSMAQAVLGWAETQKDSLAQTPDYTDADTSIKRALQLDSNNGLAHAYYAFLLGDMDQYNTGPYSDPIRSAIAESNTAISLRPIVWRPTGRAASSCRSPATTSSPSRNTRPPSVKTGTLQSCTSSWVPPTSTSVTSIRPFRSTPAPIRSTPPIPPLRCTVHAPWARLANTRKPSSMPSRPSPTVPPTPTCAATWVYGSTRCPTGWRPYHS
jgi:hypothetical protein